MVAPVSGCEEGVITFARFRPEEVESSEEEMKSGRRKTEFYCEGSERESQNIQAKSEYSKNEVPLVFTGGSLSPAPAAHLVGRTAQWTH